MKKIMFLFLLLCACSACAADITLQWDTMPAGQSWVEVRIYEHTGSGYSLVGTAPMPATTITLPAVSAGAHSYVARSFNSQDESGDSNEVSATILSKPLAPGHVIIKIVTPTN